MNKYITPCTRILMPILAVVFLVGCAATIQNNHDPAENINRKTDTFNDTLDRISLKPISKAYVAATPKPFRTAISNFYDNATYMNTVLNNFLQGKGKQGFSDFSRFIINSSLGVGGLVDVATAMGLPRHEEDFGQTLAVWGVDQGAYIVYPFFGSNSVRNTPDFITATATDGLFWAALFITPTLTVPIIVFNYIDTRANFLDSSDMRDELAIDSYIFTREAWRQHREYLIYDGNPPLSENESWDEEFDNEQADP